MSAQSHHAALVLLLLVVLCQALSSLANMTAEQHQEAGMKALTSREFSVALEHFHALCDMAPKEYMNYMRRATVFRAMGREKQAIKDYTLVLGIRPDFTQARSQRAELLLKQGDFELAQQDYQQLKGDPKSGENIAAAQTAALQLQQLEALAKAQDWANTIAVATALVEISPACERVRMLRGIAFEHSGQNGEAIGDYARAAKLSAGDTEPYARLSALYFKMGERNDAMTQVRECIKLDEEHKECFALYRKLKKLNKVLDELQSHLDNHRHDDALKSIAAAKNIEKNEKFYLDYLMTKECVVMADGHKPEAVETCTKVLEADANNIVALEHRAKAHDNAGDFEKMVADLQAALNIEADNQHLKEELQKAQKKLKQSQKRDYYKILGVPRNANDEQITKAYRKLARENHPDKFSEEKEKEEAAKRFMDIADAKEVLTDAEKRQQYDSGNDPLDAMDQQQRAQHHGFNFGGFNFGGFQHGHGGGGGGQQFHFRFQ